MNAQDQMAPDNSPAGVSGKTGIRRVNNVPMYIVGALLGVFLIVMALVAADRAAQQNRPRNAKDETVKSTREFAREIAGDQKDGLILPAKVPPPAVPAQSPPEQEPLLIAKPDDLETPPAPPGNADRQADQREISERERIQTQKMHQFEEALKARTAVQVGAPRGPGSVSAASGETLERMEALRQQIDAQTRDDPVAAYQARLRDIQAGGLASGLDTGNAMLSQAPPQPTGKNYGQFERAGQADRWRLDSRPEAPRTPFELRAGFVVPALLISGINSDLPGQIMAQVSQDVFDTATGKWKLIPQGSRLVGSYSSDVAYGQSRVLIAWQRIIFPDGKAMDIGAMPGADSAGYAGFKDKTNNHYFRLFGSAFLMSGVTAGITLSQPDQLRDGTRQSAGSAMSEALGQQLGQVTAQLIARNMNISPTLEIRPGYRFNVIVTKDMTFTKPYKAFDY